MSEVGITVGLAQSYKRERRVRMAVAVFEIDKTGKPCGLRNSLEIPLGTVVGCDAGGHDESGAPLRRNELRERFRK